MLCEGHYDNLTHLTRVSKSVEPEIEKTSWNPEDIANQFIKINLADKAIDVGKKGEVEAMLGEGKQKTGYR